MPTKDELETKLYEKMSQENEAFLAEMKTQSPDEIISHAYEIACRDNLLMLFEDETSLSEQQLAVLNEFERPLSQLYTDWLSRDTDEMDAFRDSIACCADDILRKRVEEKYRDPAAYCRIVIVSDSVRHVNVPFSDLHTARHSGCRGSGKDCKSRY